MTIDPLLEYIQTNWPRCIVQDRDGSGFAGIDLPYPYTPPCIPGEGHFSFFFYWDTYFANLGLLADGHAAQAGSNIRNICWLIRRYGFMPNHVGLVNRSQPPLLALMVEDYLAATHDTTILPEALDALRSENRFWRGQREGFDGLQRYGHNETAEGLAEFYDQVADRLGLATDIPPAEKANIGAHLMAEAESGWDFNPRFEGRCLDFLPVDLNVFLYLQENLLAGFSERLGERLGEGNAGSWAALAAERKEAILRHLWCPESGSFRDYDFVNRRHSSVDAASGFLPLFAGMVSPSMASQQMSVLPLMEDTHGMACTARREGGPTRQWAFPNAWPPLVYFTAMGLARAGFRADAERVAGKFLTTQARLFAETGQLWEKSNVITGSIGAAEYKAAPMMGWTSGVIRELHAYFFSAPRA